MCNSKKLEDLRVKESSKILIVQCDFTKERVEHKQSIGNKRLQEINFLQRVIIFFIFLFFPSQSESVIVFFTMSIGKLIEMTYALYNAIVLEYHVVRIVFS